MSTRAYSTPVYHSIMSRDLFAGIPYAGMMVLYMCGIIFVYMCKLYYFLIVIAAMYIAARILTKRDEWLIDIVLTSLLQKDEYLP